MATDTIDRDTTAPFLLKLFYKNGRHNSADDFHPTGPNPPYVEIYTWLSASVEELAHLVSENLPEMLPEPAMGTRLDFELVYPDMRSVGIRPRSDGHGLYQKKPLGSIVLGESGDNTVERRGNRSSGNKTLADAKFVIGDFIDCAVYPPLANGEVAGPARALPRENGFATPSFGSRRGGRVDSGEGAGSGAGFPTGEWRRGDALPPNNNNLARRGGRGW